MAAVTSLRWQCGPHSLECGPRTLVMGVLNVTPDSFSDGGRHFDPETAVAAGIRMVADGADILDLGGESTRPGARAVPWREEADRVLPVVKRLRIQALRDGDKERFDAMQRMRSESARKRRGR